MCDIVYHSDRQMSYGCTKPKDDNFTDSDNTSPFMQRIFETNASQKIDLPLDLTLLMISCFSLTQLGKIVYMYKKTGLELKNLVGVPSIVPASTNIVKPAYLKTAIIDDGFYGGMVK